MVSNIINIPGKLIGFIEYFNFNLLFSYQVYF